MKLMLYLCNMKYNERDARIDEILSDLDPIPDI